MGKAVYCFEDSSTFAKTLTLSPNMKSILQWPGSWLLPVSVRLGKSPSLFSHLIYGNQCRSIDFCLSHILAQWHCTAGSGLGGSLLLPAFLLHEPIPHPPQGEGFSWTSPWERLVTGDFDLVCHQIGTAQLPMLSWYTASRVHASAQLLVDNPCRPDKSSCWKSTPFLCSADILVLWIPCISSSFFNISGETPFCGMAFTDTIWAILTPLVIVIGAEVRFLATATTYLLPVAISV